MKKRAFLMIPVIACLITACASSDTPGGSGRGAYEADDDKDKTADKEDDTEDKPGKKEEEKDSRFTNRPNANTKTGEIKELSEGDVAPDFTVKTNNGGTFTLSDHDDEVVIINFWATWCPPCVGELPAFERLKEDGNAVVIGIDCAESKKDVDDFIKKNGYTYTIGYDEDYTVEYYYPTDGIPYTLVINKGIIHNIFEGAFDAETMYQEYSSAIAECLE